MAIGWLWPSRVVAESRRALAEVYRLLAGATGRLSEPRSVKDEEARVTAQRLARAILEAEKAIARSAWRPDGLAGPHKARLYMLQGARRASEIIVALQGIPRDPEGPLHGDAVALEGTLSESLDQCAVGLADGPLPDPQPVEIASREFSTRARAVFTKEVATGKEQMAMHDVAAAVFLLQQLAWGVTLAVLHCRAMSNAPLDSAPDAPRSWLLSALSDGPSAGKWLRRARRNLTPRSVHFQNSVRLAFGLALARLVVGLFDLSHGFWVAFATLVVLKTSAAGTRATAVQAAVGTAIGFGVTTAFIASFGVHDVVYAVLLPVVVFAAFYLPGAVSFVAGQACFTMVIVVLFNLIKPAGWSVGLLRLEDVLVGVVIGLVIGLAIWPRGAVSELRRVVASLFTVASGFARSTVTTSIGIGSTSTDAADSTEREIHDRVHLAAVDVEDVFSQYLSEPHQSDAPVMAWASVIAAAHRLWFGAAIASLITPISRPSPELADFASRVDDLSRSVDAGYRNIARCLDDGSRLEPQPTPRFEDRIDPSAPDESLTLLEFEVWLEELVQSLEGLRPTVTALAPAGAGPVDVVTTAPLPTA